MISHWRLIDTDLQHPYYVTAADEVLVISCAENSAPDTLHFYRRKPPGISVGYFQKVSEDVDQELCEKLGISIVRRTSAGGTIYTDQNQLIYSIITRQPIGKNVKDSFKRVCNCLVSALGMHEIKATYKPPNDVLVNGKKISGSAQVKKKNVYLIHGTIILALDQDVIERVLKQPKVGYTSSIQKECGFVPEIDHLKRSVKHAFQDEFDVTFHHGRFSKAEEKLIQELINNKYSTESWNFKSGK